MATERKKPIRQEESAGGDGLTERDRSVLEFESSWWLFPGPKDRAIREYLGMSATRYYQVLRRLIDDDSAAEHSPLTVRRLRKLRDRRLGEIAARLDEGGPSRA